MSTRSGLPPGIAEEGVGFTDYYGQQSCTAGRAAFISGSVPVRSGMTKVGLPGADLGLRDEDPTIATALKAQPLWDILSAHGKRVGIVNVPVTYPPELARSIYSVVHVG